jgi:hypothetical protein
MEEKRKRKYEEGTTIIADPKRFVSAIRFVPSSEKQRTLENERNASMSYQEFLNRNARHTTPVPVYEKSWEEALTKEPDENVLTSVQQGPVPVYNPSWKEALLREPEVGGKKRRTRKQRNTKKNKKTKKSKKTKSKRKMSFKKSRKSKR